MNEKERRQLRNSITDRINDLCCDASLSCGETLSILKGVERTLQERMAELNESIRLQNPDPGAQ